MVPDVGVAMPVTQWMVEDLPAPFGPRKAEKIPRRDGHGEVFHRDSAAAIDFAQM